MAEQKAGFSWTTLSTSLIIMEVSLLFVGLSNHVYVRGEDWSFTPQERFIHCMSIYSPKWSSHVRLYSSWPGEWVASRNSSAPLGSLLPIFGLPVISLMSSPVWAITHMIQFRIGIHLKKYGPNRKIILLTLIINKAQFQSLLMSFKGH